MDKDKGCEPIKRNLIKNDKKEILINKTEKTYSCVICKQNFNLHNQLINHFRLHGKNEIDLRGRPILESSLLKFPKKSNQIDLIKCEWCPSTFPNISKAIGHKFRKHRNESTNYFCEICGKLFPLNVALIQHKTIEHGTEKKTTTTTITNTKDIKCEFKCSICMVEFETESALNFHQKFIHATEKRLLMPTLCPPPSKKIKMNSMDEATSIYYCHLCGSEYMLKYNLRKHLEEHHSEEVKNMPPPDGIIVCKACEAIFYSKKAYEVHNINHRPDDLYVTSEEQRQKVIARIDLDFDIRRVPTTIEKILSTERQTIKKRTIPTETYIESKNQSSESLNLLNKSTTISDEEQLSPSSIAPDSSDEDS